MNNSGEQNLIL